MFNNRDYLFRCAGVGCDCVEPIASVHRSSGVKCTMVRCPRCSKWQYHCNACPFFSERKYNVQHHYSKQHQNSTPTPQVDEPNNDYEIVTDPNFDISLNGASDDESEVSDEDIEWGDYLNSLIGDDGCESESNTTSNALLFNYEELSGHNVSISRESKKSNVLLARLRSS